MRWSWPSWLSIVLGVVLLIWGLVDSSRAATSGSMMMNNMSTGWGWVFLAGAILLATGLHALQASYDGWCSGGSGGCGCCGDGCSCGDCGQCGGKDTGHEGHDHGPGEHSH